MLFESIGLPYLILFAVVTVLAFFEATTNNKLIKQSLFIFSALLVILFVALRWEIGTDWDNYQSYFFSRVNGEESPFDFYFDTGYVFLTNAIASVSDQYTIFLLVSTILSSGVIFILLGMYTLNPCLGLLVFVGGYLPIHFIGSIRRSIAIAFVSIFAFALVNYKEKIKAIPFWFVAFFFHKTSIVSLPVYSVDTKPYPTKWVVMICSLSLVLGGLNISEFVMNIANSLIPGETNIGILVTLGNYAGDTYKEHTPETINPIIQSSLSLAKKYILFLFFYMAIARKKQENYIDGKLYNIYVIGVCVYCLFLGAPILQTLSTYYTISEVFLVALVVSKFKGLLKFLFVLFVALSSFLSYRSGLYVYPDLFFPYKSVF